MNNLKPETLEPTLLSDAARLDAAADQEIAACGGDAARP
jgi:hypothetical protein